MQLPQLTPDRIRPHILKLTGGGNESQRIPGDWGRWGWRRARWDDETNAAMDGDRISRRHTPSNARPPQALSVTLAVGEVQPRRHVQDVPRSWHAGSRSARARRLGGTTPLRIGLFDGIRARATSR